MKHSVSPVVTSTWLAEHINDDTLRVVDASWHMPAAKRDAQSEYAKGHIPGAVFFDIDKHSAPSDLLRSTCLVDVQTLWCSAGIRARWWLAGMARWWT